MKRRLLRGALALISLTVLLLLLVACGGGGGDTAPAGTTTAPGTTASGTTAPGTTAPGTTAPPSIDVSVTYQITFIANGIPHRITVYGNEVPVFLGSTDVEPTVAQTFTFAGWDKEIVPATEDAIYVAQYTKSPRYYPVHFKINGETVTTVDTRYGQKPTYPETDPSFNGMRVMWTNTDTAVTGETVCEGFLTPLDPSMVSWAYDAELIRYEGTYDNDGNPNTSGSALLYLAIGEHEYPTAGALRDRVLEHLRSLMTGGNEPGFNAGPFWHYTTVSMALTVCRYTPTIWDCLTQDEKARIDLMMECFAVATSFVSDDENYYATGPGLTGNHKKTWNPNHRLAMITPIVASTVYFSAGGANGAERVNATLTGFDHDAYIARFDTYGYTRAKYFWTTPGMTLADGTVAPGAKELMMNGGTAYICRRDSGSNNNNIKIGREVGTGVGVRTTYTYGGIGLDQYIKILEKLYNNNYSSKPVISTTAGLSNGVDASGKPLAYILDGSKSPVEGEIGMMLEFIASDSGGIRSTTTYCSHDFLLVVQSLAALTVIGAYDIDTDSALFREMWVGNTDLIYKMEVGYHGFSMGKGYDHSEASAPRYLPWKSWWLEHYGDAITITRPINYTMNGGTVEGLTNLYERSEEDQVITLPTPTHIVGTFIGWFLDAEGTVTENENLSIKDGKLTVKAKYFESISLHAIFDIPENTRRGSLVYHVPSGIALAGSSDIYYYDLGKTITIALPTPVIPDGFTFIGWYRDASFTGDPLGKALTLTAEETATLADIDLYARFYKALYEQSSEFGLDPTGLPTSKSVIINGETLPSTALELDGDGSTILTKRADKDPSTTNDDGYWLQRNLSMKSGTLTINMTLYKDKTLSLMSSGIRVRSNDVNSSDFLSIGSGGTVILSPKESKVTIATLSTEPTEFTFVIRGLTDESGEFIAGFKLDAYVNGSLIAENVDYITSAKGLTAKDITVFHWYFFNTASGSIHVKDLSLVDGLNYAE